jgi:diamine N-acetyltransferase
MTVRLTTIDRSNWREALQISVHPDQLHFVADHQPVALVILAKSYIRPGDVDWVPHAIVDDNDTMVGLVALAHDASTCEIHHLVIDAPLQGQGLGRAAVGAIIEQLRQRAPTCRTLTLTVHPDNHQAQRLYRSAGFAPTGAVRHDEPVWSRNIASSSDNDNSS